MFCERLNATLNIELCIKRQKLAETKNREISGAFGESLSQCVKCPQGINVRKYPGQYTNRDYKHLLKKHEKGTK